LSSAQGVLRKYQNHGVRWIVRGLKEHARALMLCDDPGLGKTLQTLAAMDELDIQRAVIVSPAGARRVWLNEIKRWFPTWTGRIVIIEPGNVPKPQALDRPDVIVLVAYDSLSTSGGSNWSGQLTRRHWDLLVIDEAHYLKNRSNRTNAVYGTKGDNQGLQASAKHVLLLTGTPTPNHAGELFNHCRALWPQVLRRPHEDRPMSEAEFQERFTTFRETKWGRQITGSGNTTMLRERMAPYVLHRSKRSVLPELPPVIVQDIPLGMSPAKVDEELEPELRVLARNLARLSDQALYAALRSASIDGSERLPLPTLRRRLGELKVTPTVEWVTERLACGVQKLLIFGWHTRTLELLTRLLAEYDPVLIIGDTSLAARANAIDRFQHRTSVRVFVGQILAAGTAITLTAANEVAILEPSWVPGENTQAIGRAHRLGQRDCVIASYLYLPGTLDQRIMQVFRRKAAETQALIKETVHDVEHAERAEDHGNSGVPAQPRATCFAV
jgi:SWI/SNF-related matrix-associated actin-dependent regulator of chromatin subfamily A-like protein 1